MMPAGKAGLSQSLPTAQLAPTIAAASAGARPQLATPVGRPQASPPPSAEAVQLAAAPLLASPSGGAAAQTTPTAPLAATSPRPAAQTTPTAPLAATSPRPDAGFLPPSAAPSSAGYPALTAASASFSGLAPAGGFAAQPSPPSGMVAKKRKPNSGGGYLAAAGAHIMGWLAPGSGAGGGGGSGGSGDERRDRVVAASLQYSDWELGGSPRLYLVLAYANGVQVWRVDDGSSAVEVLSVRTEVAVRLAKFVPQPFGEGPGDVFARERPLLAVLSAETQSALWPSKMIRFYSLRHHRWYRQLCFDGEVVDFHFNKQLFVVQLAEELVVHEPVGLNELLKIRYPGKAASVAVGPRWLAFPSAREVPASELAEAEFSAWRLVTSAGSALISGINSIGAAAAQSLKAGDEHYATAAAAPLHGYQPPPLPPSSSSLSNQSALLSPSAAAAAAASSSSSSSSSLLGPGHHYRPGDGHMAFMAAGAVEVCEIDGQAQAGPGRARTIAHFQAHNESIASLTFSPDGSLLATTDLSGQECRVFLILPARLDVYHSHHHLYTLTRGLRRASITAVCFSQCGRWVALNSSHGTAHLYPINPHGGGKANVYTHGEHSADYRNFVEARVTAGQLPETTKPFARLQRGATDTSQRLALRFVHYQQQRHPSLLVADSTGLLTQHALLTSCPPPDSRLDKSMLLVALEAVAEWDCCRREGWAAVHTPAALPAAAHQQHQQHVWLANMENATHAARQNELWRSPRFSFEEFITPDDKQQAFLHGNMALLGAGAGASSLRDAFYENRPVTRVSVRDSAPVPFQDGAVVEPANPLAAAAALPALGGGGGGLAEAMQTQLRGVAAATSAARAPASREQSAHDFHRYMASAATAAAGPVRSPADLNRSWTTDDLAPLLAAPRPVDERRPYTTEDLLSRRLADARLAARGSSQPSDRRLDVIQDARQLLAIRDADPRSAYPLSSTAADYRSADPRHRTASDPRYADPRYPDTRYSPSSATDPRYALSSDPRYRSSSATDPRYPATDPRYAPSSVDTRLDPRYATSSADPRYPALSADPRYATSSADPRYATSSADPRSDPRYATSSRSDPRYATSSADPRSDPRYATSSADPRSDPRYATSSADPRSDPRYAASSADPRSDPRYATSSADPRSDPRYATSSDPRYGTSSADPRYAPSSDPRYASSSSRATDPRYAADPRQSRSPADPRVDLSLAPASDTRSGGVDPRYPSSDPRYAGLGERQPSGTKDPLAINASERDIVAAGLELQRRVEAAKRAAAGQSSATSEKDRALALLADARRLREAGPVDDRSRAGAASPMDAAMSTRR